MVDPQVRSEKPARVRIRFELAKGLGCRPMDVALRLRAFMVIMQDVLHLLFDKTLHCMY